MDAIDKKLGLAIKPDNGRVTAGLPSLDPSKRFEHDRRMVKAEKQRFIAVDTDNKRDAAVAPDGTRSTTNYDAQRGTELHSVELMRRLRLMNPNLRFEIAIAAPDRMGIYMGDKFLCGMLAGISPEFTVRLYTIEEIADPITKTLKKVKECTGIQKGWRDVLLQLMKFKCVTKSQVDKMFGVPGRDSKNWQLAVQ